MYIIMIRPHDGEILFCLLFFFHVARWYLKMLTVGPWILFNITMCGSDRKMLCRVEHKAMMPHNSKNNMGLPILAFMISVG